MKVRYRPVLAIAILVVLVGGALALTGWTGPLPGHSSYLFVWAGEMNVAAWSGQSEGALRGMDFLAVLDVNPQEPRYGRLVATLPVDNPATFPHHTNYELPVDDKLFANDFDAARTLIFDLSQPLKPRLAASFGAAGPFTHPHSFVHLPDGNTLATFQQQGDDDSAPGALVELDPEGRVVRSSPAADPQVESFIRPYSLEVVPSLDRAISTSADMDSKGVSHVVQVWSLSGLKLLKTVTLTRGFSKPAVTQDSSEPRLLADGRTVLVGTFNCGLYRMDGLEGNSPSAELVYDFGGRKCSVPVVAGHFWIEALESTHCIVSLDVSDPSHPVEAGRIVLGPRDLPHWLALDPESNRIVITGYGSLFYRVLMATIDPNNGKLALDERFREDGASESGFSFERNWPDGWKGPAIPHGAVFSRGPAK